MNRILVIAWKELLQLRRDRLTFAMMVAVPLVQLMLFGFAINSDIRHIPMVVYDQDHSARSRDLARSLEATGFFEVVGAVRGYTEIAHAMETGDAQVGLVVPFRFGAEQVSGRPTTVQLVVDGSDPQVVGSALSAASGLVAARATQLTVARFGPSAAAPQLISLEPAIWYNPDQRTAVFVVPGLIGVIITMTMVMITAMAIARERERGTLEQLIVSPVRKVELIIGKILPYTLMGYVQMTLVLIAGRLLFDVPVVGSIPLLYAMAFLFIAANLAMGLFFSTLAKTQQQAMQMSFFFLLPNMLLSGFMFPFDGMPKFAQYLAQTLPLTHFLRIVRGITLKGSHFAQLAPEFYSMGAIVVVLVTLASARFSKKLL
jgi:ABC-2 type transport system permease protein